MVLKKKLRVGLIAPSFLPSKIELKHGIEKLKTLGFEVELHPQNKLRSGYFAGEDQKRAQAFWDFAMRPEPQILWSVRGGYGALRLLPFLEKWTSEQGIPEKKLFVGYSDSTILGEYVRRRWNWTFLHAPMPGLREFLTLGSQDERALLHWIKHPQEWSGFLSTELKFFLPRYFSKTVQGKLVGGNLKAWTSMVGSPFLSQREKTILFLEDIGEKIYSIDWMMEQLYQSKNLSSVQAIVLGEFIDCKDTPSQGLKSTLPNDWQKWSKERLKKYLSSQEKKGLKPTRSKIAISKGLRSIFERLSEELEIPIAYGLRSGHGEGKLPLPMGAEVELLSSGKLRVLHWP